MSPYLVESLEREMVARSFKHLVFDLLRDRPDIRAAPGLTLVTLLNYLFGAFTASSTRDTTTNSTLPEPPSPTTSNPSPSPSPLPAVNTTPGSSSRKNRRGKRGVGGSGGGSTPNTTNVVSSSVYAQPQKTISAPPQITLTREEFLDMLYSDIRQRYRYHFKPDIHNICSHPVALLRRVCQKLGLRIYSRSYDFASRQPFTLADIVEVRPVTKTCAPLQPLPEAREVLEQAKLYASTGNPGAAFELAQEATALYQQIHGQVHSDVAKCLDLLAAVLFHVSDLDAAVLQQQKALAMHWQTTGFDSFEAISTQSTLAIFLQAAGRTDEAIRHMRACLYLLELVGGPRQTELPHLYFKLAGMLQELGLLPMAYKSMMIAVDRSHYLPDPLTEAHINHQMAMYEDALSLFKEGLIHEKKAYTLHKEIYGEKDPRTVQLSLSMERLTQKAVEKGQQQRKAQVAGEEDSAALAAATANKTKSKNSKKKSGSKSKK